MKLKKSFVLVVGMFIWANILAVPAEVKDHPVIKPIPGSTLDSSHSEYKNFDAYTFKYEQNGESVEKKVKGKYWKLDYNFLKEDGKRDESVSVLEILENFKQAALEKSGEVLREDDRNLIFTLISDGIKIWTHLEAGSWKGWYRLHIVEEKGFKKKLTFDAEEIKKELDEKGQIAIYGIYFDLDKSTLKIEAEKTLIEIVKLMKSYPELKIEIQGHTDSQGSREYNLKLSEKRSETVKSFITLYGIDSSRMTTKGFGPDKPIASNDTEEGRSKNRRVELKKL